MPSRWVLFLLLAVIIPSLALGDIIDFESFNDGDSITTQIPGLTFTNTTVLTAGVSLNEFEFPPHSGINVVSDNGGPITIDFATPATSVGAYFTYLEPLTLAGYDSSNNLVGVANSLFNSNLALSGDPGSTPNEFLQVMDASGVSSVVITGDPAGSSFTMDDLTYQTSTVPVVTPEPNSLLLLIVVLVAVLVVRRRRSLPLPGGQN